ncbi:MAG: c-type cytochrome, partial [Verrucomicrobiota bacterium]
QVLFDDTLPPPAEEPLPAARVSIAADGPAAPVFRRSPDEPWRVLRTRWRASGLVNGLVEGGGRPSGYFTGATGTTLYRGDAYGPDYLGQAFVADCGSNLIHRKRLRPGPDGLEWIGERDPSEAGTEFLASTDNWFRPVQFYNAPDGCLWVLDMYREVIEHPWSLPAGLKQHLDLNSGNDRGRLWRLQPAGFETRPGRRRGDELARATPAAWVGWLDHPNAWHRETAARLLHARQDPATLPPLRALATQGRSSPGRQHALQVLQGLRALDADTWSRAARDPEADVRAQAATLLVTAPGVTAGAWKTLASDASPRVRLEVALRVQHSPADARREILERLLSAGPERVARLAARGITPADLALWPRVALRKDLPLGTRTGLARVLGRRARPGDIPDLLAQLEATPAGLELAWALGEGTAAAGRPLREQDQHQRLDPLRALARQALESSRPDSPSTSAPDLLGAAIRFLSLDDPAAALPRLVTLVGAPGPEPVLAAAWQALGGIPSPDWAPALGRLLGPHPGLRPRLVALLLRRTEGQRELLDALAEGRLRLTDLPAEGLQRLRQSGPPAQQARARELLGDPPADRRAVLDQFLPALNLKGDAARGTTVFQERCASCHRLRDRGQALGPDLASVAANGPEKLLVNILDPNREVSPNHVAWTAETAEGETVTGLLGAETPAGVTLRLAGGSEVTVPRTRLKNLRAEGRSLMPEGLELGLNPQAMADLLAALAGP